jgi:predicted DNA-binding protein (MmcQ/YjbR family)
MATGRKRSTITEIEQFALELPEAWIDTPWGDRVVKVGKKIFVFLSSETSERPGITVKLPESRDHALSYAGSLLPGYGLGKHGWVTVYLDGVPAGEHDVLLDFVEESYRTVAPKTLVKRLDADR